MELTKITDRIYSIPKISEIDRPYLYYIKGNQYSVAIDAGQSEQHVKEFYEAIEKAGFPLPEYTVITHWHWDHSFGIPYIKGKTIANELTNRQLEFVKTWEWNEPAMRQREKDGLDIEMVNNDILKVYPDLSKIVVEPAQIGISEMMELDMGDIHLQLYPCDSIHSRDALIAFCPEEKALFIGDADCEDHYGNILVDKSRVGAYMELVSKLDYEVCYIGHDLPDDRNANLDRLGKMYRGEDYD